MRRILVTAVSGDIANGILKILQHEDNILYGCDVNEIAVGMDLVRQFWQCRYAADEYYIDELLQKCEQYNITHLIPVNEREIEAVGKNRDRFLAMGVKPVIQSREVLDICLDKYKTACFLSENGLTVPATYDMSSLPEDGDRRFICKPRKSNGSKNIFWYAPDKASESGIESGDYVVQEYIDSDEEYTIGVFGQCGCINTIIFRRELKNGYSNLVKLAHDEEMEAIAGRVAGLFDLSGYINIQLKKYNGRYYIFEINPRISGTVRFRHMLGFSDVIWWLDMLDGKKIEKYNCQYSEAVGIRELNEKYLILR